MRILLVGKGGQVGSELQAPLAASGDLVALDRTVADLERPDDVAALVRRERPNVIVNAAAYTAVDKAEGEADRARLVNAMAVDALARAAADVGATLVHYSTDYVFDGTKAGRYVETDAPHPLSVYGQTKLEGEEAIAASGCNHWVFRTTWVYAAHGHNFVRTMLRLGRERDELRVVDDQFGVPTSARLIAAVTAECIARLAAGSAMPAGIYHLAPRGETTWCRFARTILAEARGHGIALRCPPENVIGIATADYPLPARRPANSLLDTAKLETALTIRLPEWQDDVPSVVAALVAGPAS
ncbi:MAG: dTDP-4-dehydrorhamnose reductase [Planctomycetaceae bacterium]